MNYASNIDQNILLTTKLSIPHKRSNSVPRPRLVERLDQVKQHKLALLVAPAGSGKTGLLHEWIAHNERVTHAPSLAWLTLDEDDNDVLRFWRYCIAALRTRQPHLGENALALLQALQSPLPSAINSVLSLLLNDIAALSHNMVLILDDYHLIQSQDIHSSLVFLLDHLPPYMHLVIISRTEPDFPLARLRTRGELIEIHAPDLRFILEETTTFLGQVMGLQLPPEDVRELGERTEGWVAGLQLAALSLQGRQDSTSFVRSFSGCDRYVLDYLLEEVFHRQPASIQQFLLNTSILDVLHSAICNAVNESEDGQLMLETLERANLFVVALDNERRLYRYHRLFAELLRYRLQQLAPQRVVILHRRAAAWYEQQDMIARAIPHALSAQDAPWAGRLISQVAESMALNGEVSTVQAWLKKLPDALVRSQPQLSLIYALVLLVTSRFDAVETYLQDAERVITAHNNHNYTHAEITDADMQESPRRDILALLGRIDALRATVAINFGHYDSAIELTHRALKRLPESDRHARGVLELNLGDAYAEQADWLSAERIFEQAITSSLAVGNTVVALATLGSLGTLHATQGHLRQAVTVYQHTIQIATEHADGAGHIPPPAGKAYVLLAHVLYEWNDLENAKLQVNVGIDLCKQWGHVRHLLDGLLILVDIQLAQEDTQGAAATLEAAQRLLEETRREKEATPQAMLDRKYIWLLNQLDVAKANLWMVQGDVTAVAHWARTHHVSADNVPITLDSAYLLLVRLLIAQGEPAQAISLLERLAQLAERRGEMWYAIYVYALQAVALQAQGNNAQAVITLKRALVLAEPEGYMRAFLARGLPMLTLLRQVSSHSLVEDYVSKLLKAFGAYTTPSTLLEPLTERELDILRLLAAGMSNREIAASLVITLGTVKWYVNSIYGKLNVNSRVQAVARAKELRLLS